MTVINLSPEVALKLETIATQMRGKEFSGIGFATHDGKDFNVYEVILIATGSEAYTEIPSQKLLAILDRPDAANMKLWFHRHGVGDGFPGRHNWSGVDERTCTQEPLGAPVGTAHLVKWSLAIVRTPNGWVGRYDKHGEKPLTTHLRVVPSYSQTVNLEIDVIQKEIAARYEAEREKEKEKERETRLARIKQPHTQAPLPNVRWANDTGEISSHIYTALEPEEEEEEDEVDEIDELYDWLDLTLRDILHEIRIVVKDNGLDGAETVDQGLEVIAEYINDNYPFLDGKWLAKIAFRYSRIFSRQMKLEGF